MDVCAKLLQCVWPFAIPWTVAHQDPLSMGFSRREYWSGLPCPSPGDLPDPGIKPVFLTSPSLAGWFFTISTPWQWKCSKDAKKVPKERIEQHVKMQIYTEASTFRDLVRNWEGYDSQARLCGPCRVLKPWGGLGLRPCPLWFSSPARWGPSTKKRGLFLCVQVLLLPSHFSGGAAYAQRGHFFLFILPKEAPLSSLHRCAGPIG